MSRYVVVDLEMCSVPAEKRKACFPWGDETIQIGAVLLDEEYHIVDEFNTYVCPKYGFIDDFISRLTGIGQEDVKNAPSMEEAMQEFVNWIPEGAYMVSWSNSDLIQIRKELELKGLKAAYLKQLSSKWIDCQKLFSEKVNDDQLYRLSEAISMTDIIWEGRAHNGLMDAKNTARLYAKMMTEPKLNITHYNRNERTVYSEKVSYTLGDMLKNTMYVGL